MKTIFKILLSLLPCGIFGQSITITGRNSTCSGIKDTLQASGGRQYNWSTGDTTAALVVSPYITSTYTLIGIDTSGAIDTLTYTVIVNVCSPTDSTPDWNSMMMQQGANFYVIRNKVARYFKNVDSINQLHGIPLNTVDSNESRLLSRENFNRWSAFWQNRCGEGSDSLAGNFTLRAKMLYDYFIQHNGNGNHPHVMSYPCASYPGNWSFVSMDNSSSQDLGQVRTLCFDTKADPSFGTLYIGTTASGVWKTTNAQSSSPNWTNLTDASLPGIGVQCIAADPNNAGTIYVGTGTLSYYADFGIGVIKSTDGGVTWVPTVLNYPLLSAQQDFIVRKILVDPSNSNNVWAMTNTEVYYSSDGLQNPSNLHLVYSYSYTHRSNGWISNLRSMVFDPNNPNCVIVSSTGFSDPDLAFDLSCPCYMNYGIGCEGATIYQIFSNSTVNQLSLPSPLFDCSAHNPPPSNIDLSTSPTTGIISVMFNVLMYTPPYTQGNYLCDLNTSNSNPWGTLISASGFNGDGGHFVSPTDASVMYASGNQMQRSTDGGQNWSTVSNYNSTYEHADVRNIFIQQGSPVGTYGGNDIVWMGNDGGIGETQSTGGTQAGSWLNKNGTGLGITEFYSVDVSPTDASIFLGGCQDNGSFYNSSQNPWHWVLWGDGYDCAIDQNNPNNAYAWSDAAFEISANGGLNFVNSGCPLHWNPNSQIIIDPVNSNCKSSA